MANIKRLRMAGAICGDERISVSSSFFGLTTKAVYRPTGSIVDADVMELTREEGNQLKAVVEAPRGQLARLAADCHLQSTVNGNYMLEKVVSRDHAFVALRLYQFLQMQYEAVTDVLVFEGDDARLVAQMF